MLLTQLDDLHRDSIRLSEQLTRLTCLRGQPGSPRRGGFLVALGAYQIDSPIAANEFDCGIEREELEVAEAIDEALVRHASVLRLKGLRSPHRG